MPKCANCGLDVPEGLTGCPRCGHGESTLAADLARTVPASRLGRFDIVSELGRGGMGVVYRAWDPLLARVVALKTMIDPSASADIATSGETSVRRFLREARTMSRLSHPNVVRVYEVGSEGGTHWLTMDYVEGTSLAALLHPDAVDALAATRTSPTRRDPAPLPRLLEILRDVARGVAYAHAQGVLHLDLKPGNILVDREGKAYVTDFGLARDISTAEVSLLTESGALLGTPQYMSPEQAEGRSRDVTAASDVFSMGVILYEALTSRLPFNAPALAEILRNISELDPAPPSSIRADVPRDAEVVCLRCLEKDPSRRYASMEALAADLAALVAGEPIQARPASLWRRAVRAMRRHPGALRAAAVVGMLALVAVVGRYAWQDYVRGRVEALCAQAQQRLVGDPASAEAERLLDDAIRYGTDSPKPYVLRGEVRARRREVDAALGDLRKALSLDPSLDWARLRVAQLLIAKGDRVGGSAEFGRLADQQPGTVLGGIARGITLSLEGRFAEALKELDRALSLEPTERLRAYLLMAKSEALVALRRLDEAARCAQQAQQADPFDPAPHALRAWALSLAGAQEEALAEAERALSIDATSALAHLVKGQVLVGSLDFKAALVELDVVIADPTFEADGRSSRGYLRFQSGDYPGAAEDFARFLELRPSDPSAPEIRRMLGEARKRIR